MAATWGVASSDDSAGVVDEADDDVATAATGAVALWLLHTLSAISMVFMYVSPVKGSFATCAFMFVGRERRHIP